MASAFEVVGPFIVDKWTEHNVIGVEIFSIKTTRANVNLLSEARKLSALAGGIGFPNICSLGKVDGHMAILTDDVGDSLETLFDKCGRYFDMPILLEFACQLISRLEWMHKRHISHGSLQPSSLTIGAASWQTPQITISHFGHGDPVQFLPQMDLEAVGDILLYLATGSVPWDTLKACERSEIELPHTLGAYFSAIRSRDLNPADYVILRNIFDSARQSLEKKLFGGMGVFQQEIPTLKNLSSRSTGDLFERLGLRLSGVGETVSRVAKGSLTLGQARSISQRLDEILVIYMALLVRDEPSTTPPKYSMSAYHLPNRLWRDMRWYLCISSCFSPSFQFQISLRIYKFVGVLLEINPMYNKYWTRYLSELSHTMESLDMRSSFSWRQAWIYWKDCANYLKRR
ncbi:hypothetical protein N7492_002174 [Penicillium capsulatum]|uniref:Protein kinase domain-containing protein n=1 Tax=Penicillium capsulatum TaxID=69766 RepID=A0A9W9IHC6_9EURO|nr:hypothetical protein N7492_002174 [Penicillium capsulatum]KAJ6123217.1 hypothetical protein N7512_005682 [Penicillium capsulatum]